MSSCRPAGLLKAAATPHTGVGRVVEMLRVVACGEACVGWEYRPPRCARCGYDRTGLRGQGARCPECGSRRIDLPWRGWRAVLLDTTLPIAVLAACGYGAIVGIAFVRWELAQIVRLVALGVVGVAGILRPFDFAGFYAAGKVGFPGRPGRRRIVVVGVAINATLAGVLCGWLPMVYPGLWWW